jgi:hypothetical protein
LLHYSQGLLFPEEFPVFIAVLGSALYCVFLVVEVAALSLSYRALSTQGSVSEEQSGVRNHFAARGG